MSPWVFAYAFAALTLTVVGIVLRRASRNPSTPRGDAVLIDLGLGLVAAVACVFWLQAVALALFQVRARATPPRCRPFSASCRC
ncbi:MAG: hypothetical protein AB1425_16490 [Actinomycetota bacterium]